MDPTADPMLEVALHVTSYHEAVVRLDERRRWSQLLKAHDQAGDFAAAQRALDALRGVTLTVVGDDGLEVAAPFDHVKAKRGVAWLVGSLQRITEDEPDVEPFQDLADKWIGRTA